MDTFKGERCGVDNCRSREYHVENGLTYCRRGHVQEGRIEHEQEYEDLNPSASQTTRIRDTEKEARDKQELQKLSGPFGLKLFRLAYEFLLRKQAEILVKTKNFPPAFEQILKELWALRVLIAREQGVDLNSEGVPARHSDDSSNPSDTETEEAQDPGFEGSFSHRGQLPKLLEMFALCYLAAEILRIPLPVSTLHRWIVADELIFAKAHHAIPVQMRNKFGRRFHSVFNVLKPLTPERLHLTLAEECRLMLTRFKSMKLPPLNWSPLLLDYLMRIGLPLHIYTWVESISDVLGIDFTFKSPKGRGRTAYLSRLPELQLVAMVVFSVKFHHPLNGKEQFAKSASDPSYLTVDWAEWQRSHARMDEELRGNGRIFAPGEEIGLKPSDVYDLTDQQMDAYMDWFSNTWLDPSSSGKIKATDRRIGVPEGVRKMFPLQENVSQESDPAVRQQIEADLLLRLLREIYVAARPRGIVSEETVETGRERIPRAGTHYARYRSQAQLEVQPFAKAFHEKVAQIAGVSIKTLLLAVWHLEEEILVSEDRIKEYTEKGQKADQVERREQV